MNNKKNNINTQYIIEKDNDKNKIDYICSFINAKFKDINLNSDDIEKILVKENNIDRLVNDSLSFFENKDKIEKKELDQVKIYVENKDKIEKKITVANIKAKRNDKETIDSVGIYCKFESNNNRNNRYLKIGNKTYILLVVNLVNTFLFMYIKKPYFNTVFYGVPGCGKSYYIKNKLIFNYVEKEKEGQIIRTVFHPDYTYGDFVGQILPKTDKGNVTYEFKPGPFTKILKSAYENPDCAYYLIIEEINRGNAPAIFGDIFQLLDRKGNGESEYSIENEDIAKEILKSDKFKKINKREDKEKIKEELEKIKEELEKNQIKIPANLTLLATMNTSDQNVFTLDTAFQRRWKMRMILNGKPNVDLYVPGTNVKWCDFWEKINSKIAESNNIMSAEDKRLGTYFVKESDLSENANDTDEDKIRDFAEKVFKYLWDDAFKMNRKDIFKIKENENDNNNIRTLEDVIVKCQKEIPLKDIFKIEFNSAVIDTQSNDSATQSGGAVPVEVAE